MMLRPSYVLPYVFALFIATTQVHAARSSFTADDPRLKVVEQQNDENEEWRRDAIDKEKELINQANQFLKDKEYQKAANAYQEVLSLTYQQWDIKEVEVGGFKTLQPARDKKRVKLNTGNTRTARDKLRGLGDLIESEREKADQEAFKQMFEDIEVALMLENQAKAYGICSDIISAAARSGEKKYAVEAAIKAAAKQQDILKIVTPALDEMDKLVAEGKTAEAREKFLEFTKTQAALLEVVPELKTRLAGFLDTPEMRQESREQQVLRYIEMGDAALLREDYVAAVRNYRNAATLFPESPSAKLAAEKLAKLQEDPKIIKAIERAEIDAKARPIMQHAENMLRLGRLMDAGIDCAQIISEFPDSSYAGRARSILEDIERQSPDPEVTP